MSDAAWDEYLTAARRLDALRRGAVTAEEDPGRAAAATLEELARVRARLAAQHTRLRSLGVPEEELRPSPAELAAAWTGHGEPRGVHDGGAPVATDHPAGGGASAAGGFTGGGALAAGQPDGGGALPADGPGTIWAALHRSRALAERADAALAAPRGWAALLRWGRARFTRHPR